MRPINNKSSPAVPKLRFPEFVKEGEWVEKSIGSIAKVTAGGTPSSTEAKYWGGNIPWMNSGELNLKRVHSVANYITELGLKESSTKKISPLCVLIGLAGQGKTRGTAAINYIELCTNQSIASIHPNSEEFISKFLYQLVDSMYNKLRSLSKGEGGRGGLNLQIIKSIKIALPSIKEQQKIADCLSSFDALITTQTQKLQALQQHKKGLMQNLFPAEGKTTPKLRFPEFVGCETWAVKSLKDISETTSGGTPLKHKREYYDAGAVPWLTSGEVAQGLIYQSKNTITELGLKESSAKIFPKNTILIAMYGATAGKVGLLKFKSSTNQAICGILPNNKLVSDFLYQYLVTKTEIIAELGGGGAQPNISQAIIKKLKVPCPEKQEQQKIADCLSSLDALITTQTQKLQALQQHKKGLMQGLFPIQLS